jgi:DNA-binding NarL/FixJ family response regulator
MKPTAKDRLVAYSTGVADESPLALASKAPIYNDKSSIRPHLHGLANETLFPGCVVMEVEHSPISVLIASKTAMAGELIAAALNRQSRFRVVTSVITDREVLGAARSVDVDVALISATLADGPLSGFEALRHLRECSPDVKTVLLLDDPEPNLVIDAFRAGARGIFCPSQSPFKALCRCIDRVHSGQIWAKSSELVHVLDAFCKLAPLRLVNAEGSHLLTKREEDVVRLLGEGMQNREIAQELDLSEHTVKNYLFHIFDKLGVSSRVELILYAANGSKEVQGVGVQGGEDVRAEREPPAA